MADKVRQWLGHASRMAGIGNEPDMTGEGDSAKRWARRERRLPFETTAHLAEAFRKDANWTAAFVGLVRGEYSKGEQQKQVRNSARQQRAARRSVGSAREN